ncbi:Glu S.griseus protease inhibitor [Thalictrum thalictroides]|uniref:Glu S.griseus protease inhibitor n=1 Tax=Thalictrum thalictroides TaxID=46969 RepID=A0A7J6W6N1_THATH|nr:Glu S.griseus protease inhibitor [Thalictrum thalictroides]
MADVCPGDSGKGIWPELLGVRGKVAVKVINKENPKLSVSIVEEGMMVTMDFRCDRVRVWVDKHGFVKEVPRIG